MNESSDDLIFFVNGRKIVEASPDPGATLLQYLRRSLYLTGTKEGCGHGGCGSCTVMISTFDRGVNTINMYLNVLIGHMHEAVNACLLPVCAVHGRAVTTVEGVGGTKTGLHQVQKSLIASHGLQCGFCTPGFIMSMFTLLRNNQTPTTEQVEKALEGNLCRCTGYRPILDAFKIFTKEECSLGEECCKTKDIQKATDTQFFQSPASTTLDDSQVAIFPSELQFSGIYEKKQVTFRGGNLVLMRPTSLSELAKLKMKHPDACIMMGNTAAARLRTNGVMQSNSFIYGAHLTEMKEFRLTDDGIVLGAGLTFTELDSALADAEKSLPEEKCRFIPAFRAMIRRYGADQIRNIATIGGNILCGVFTSDLHPLLLVVGASMNVLKGETVEHVRINDRPNLGASAVLKSITVPYSTKNDYLEFYKHQDRRTFSTAAVNAAVFVTLEDNGGRVKIMNMAVGGLSDCVWSVPKLQELVDNRIWNSSLLDRLLSALSREEGLQQPEAQLPSSGIYKQSIISSFVFKFYLSVLKRLTGHTDLDTYHFLHEHLSALNALPCDQVQTMHLYDACTDTSQPDHDAVGRPLPNVASESLVTGEAVFTDDIPKYENELFLALVKATKAHARIVSVDPSPALTIPGVHGFVDYKDIPGTNTWGVVVKDEEVFVSKEVTYYRQPIAGVLADTRECARKAAELVIIEYEPLVPVLTIEDAIKQGSVHGSKTKLTSGDVDKAFSQEEANIVVEGSVTTGLVEQFYMETHVCLVVPRTESSEIEVTTSAHGLALCQGNLAVVLGIPQNRVTCKVKRMGGSFGGKETRFFMLVGPAAVAAFKYKRPVRCLLEREEDMAITGKRHPFLAKYKVAVNKQGKFVALDIDLFVNGGNSTDVSHLILECAMMHIDNTYNIPNFRINGTVCKTNTPSNTAFRGFGSPQAVAIIETVVANVSYKLGIPQEKVRELNLYKHGDTTPYGMPLDDCTISACWENCIERSQLIARRQSVDNYNKHNLWKKRGIAMTPLKYGIGFPANFLNQGAALVHIYTDGSVLISHGGTEMGQGLNTKIIQIASRALDIPATKIYITEASTDKVPNPTVTAGSIGTDLYGPAVLNACKVLSGRLEPYIKEDPQGTWENWVNKAYFDKVQLSATGFFTLPKGAFNFDNCSGRAYCYYSYGVCCSEVEIDCLTGESQILRADIVMDVGKSLNPGIDIGQIEGGFVQGVGMMTIEQVQLSEEDGRVLNSSPLTYKIPNISTLPRQFNVNLLKNDKIITPIYSAKAIGEPPLLLSVSVLMAIREALVAARKDVGITEAFTLNVPATAQRIRELLGDQMSKIKL